MLFTSFRFLVFLLALFAGYFLLPKRVRWMWLLLGSAFFYLCTGLKYCLFLLASILSAWAFGLACGRLDRRAEAYDAEEHSREEKRAFRAALDKKRRLAAALVIVFNLGVLAVLKYADFVLANVAAAVRLFVPSFQIPSLGLLLPLGISFYTFMAVGYCVDVYRGVTEAERNPFKLALFLSFFPHITQGPIDRYDALASQLFEGRGFDFDRVQRGLCRMLWGFFQKLVVADRLAILVDHVFDAPGSFSGLYLAFAVVCYAVQIYADFAGYMDIALGAGRVLGIELAENFDAPYLSSGIPEYWRRWHITLGAWFRDYLFYPIQRSAPMKKLSRALQKRRSRAFASLVTTSAALAVVWFATGLWHGASWHYIAWGVYYGVLIILSTWTKPLADRAVRKLRIDRETSGWRMFCVLRTFALVLVGYVLFRAANMAQAAEIFGRIVTRFLPSNNAPGVSLGLDMADLKAALLGTAVIFIADMLKLHKVDAWKLFRGLPLVIRWAVLYAAIAAVLVYGVYGPDYNAASFIYFRF